MNNVTLIGRITADPELGYTQSQKAMCRFTLAVDRAKEGTDFIRIVAWDRQAENVNRFLHKGSKCAVNGRIQTGSYKDKDGKTVYTTDVVATNVEFLDSKPADKPADLEATKRQAEDLLGVNDYGSFEAVTDGMPF